MELGFLSRIPSHLLPQGNKRAHSMLNTFRGIFDRAIDRALSEKGIDALKQTSLFGSNDSAMESRKEKPKAA